ncbi:MAG: tetratricopeptide repeat protein [Planctomycetes bacterium]|nr:tetratricopeptide repeat protein [Planctomycetota bacterium]
MPHYGPPGPEPVLPLAESFVREALPALITHLRRWKGLDPRLHPEVLEDLRQDLALDCLLHEPEIRGLSPRERNARWFRLLERSYYRMRLRGRCASLDEVCEEPPAPEGLRGAESALALVPAGPMRARAEALLATAERRGNGRVNATATAARLGLRPREVRSACTDVAIRLGYGDEFMRFWRRRLVEALTGLAADLLRDARLVHLVDEARRARPDPRGRGRRIRRIRAVLCSRPLPRDLKEELAQAMRLCRGTADPRACLEAAARLAPRDPGVQLWLFEAALAEGDLRAAARALRRARAWEAEPGAAALALARFCEARGRPGAALRVIERAHRRAPRDPRLRAALAALAG